MGSMNMRKPTGDGKLSCRNALPVCTPFPGLREHGSGNFPTLASGVVILGTMAFYTVPVGICEVACVPAA